MLWLVTYRSPPLRFLPLQGLNTLLGIAVTTSGRVSDFPLTELGHPELLDNTWFAFSGPPELSDEIIRKLNKAVAAAVTPPDVQDRFRRDVPGAAHESRGIHKSHCCGKCQVETAIERTGLAANAQ